MRKSQFPDGFYFGSSTASHQVEGGTHNQWSVWEKANAKRLAKEAEKQASSFNDLGYKLNWQAIASQATKPSNYISANGVEHYQRYREDFRLSVPLTTGFSRWQKGSLERTQGLVSA